jgi:hypothetical protein
MSMMNIASLVGLETDTRYLSAALSAVLSNRDTSATYKKDFSRGERIFKQLATTIERPFEVTYALSGIAASTPPTFEASVYYAQKALERVDSRPSSFPDLRKRLESYESILRKLGQGTIPRRQRVQELQKFVSAYNKILELYAGV